MGTPQFAVPTLERIVEAGHEVTAVFTQPDRPKGRGQKDAMPPVKEAALRMGLRVHQPERVRRPEVVEQLRALGPEAMVVVGYVDDPLRRFSIFRRRGSSTCTRRCCLSIGERRRFSGRSRAGKLAPA